MAEASLPPGYRLLTLDTVGSTNDEAGARAAAGEGHGLVVLARSQNAGRGRRGRTWVSPDGNLHVSILVEAVRPLPEAAQLSFVTALALAETLAALLPNARIQCKWPNDVLVEDRKIGGILLEGTGDGQVIVGIGVNLRHRPDDALILAVTLSECGVETDPRSFLSSLLDRFELRRTQWALNGFEPIRAQWLLHAKGIGHAMVARTVDREFIGTFVGIDGDGALLLEGDDATRRIFAADVFFPAGGT